jgi:dolichol-phosphate mannosyltransferase
VRVSIIVPVLYAEPQLEATLTSLRALSHRVDLETLVVVDVPDPQRESMARAQNDPIQVQGEVEVLYRIGKRGFGSALRFGFSHGTGDMMIPVMGDLSDDVEAIPLMIGEIERGWDVVGGSRYVRGGAVIGNTLKQRFSRLYSTLVRFAGGPGISDITNSFKAYRREVVSSVVTVADSFDLSVELTLKAARAGFRITEVPAVWTNRTEGDSNWRLWRELWNYGRWLILAPLWRSSRGQRALAR